MERERGGKRVGAGEESLGKRSVLRTSRERKIISIQFTSKLMVMSSFLMNSSPAAYNAVAAANVDPKFPPSEEYSQGNYIPDYYGTAVVSSQSSGLASAQSQSLNHHTHHHHQQSAIAAAHHYGYHHHPALYPSALQDQSPLGSVPSGALSSAAYHASTTGHHHTNHHHLNSSSSSSSGLHGSQSYYNPCTGTISHGGGPNAASHLMGSSSVSASALGNSAVIGSHHVGTRIPSPSSSLPLPLHRSPSPRSQSMGGNLVEPPSPPDCSGSDSDSETNPTVIYPWMKKVHVNQGKFFFTFFILLFLFLST